MPTVALHTLGCRLNYAETSAISRQFALRGYAIVPFGEPADVCVINTCTVTAQAERECRRIIRRAVRSSADPLVVVTGCYAQLEPERVASIPGVDVVLGSTEKLRLFDHVPVLEKTATPRVIVQETTSEETFGSAYSAEGGDRTRAFLKIQDGCDYSCSFCTIPRARGGSRSQSVDACVAQAVELVRSGFRDITLTGVNVGDYRGGGDGGLLPLLRGMVRIPGLDRIRISSIEPNLLGEELLEFIAASGVVCPHLHIPLQSGSDTVLRRMRRRYTARQYVRLIERIVRRIPDCGIGADVIVGFPGESDEEFAETHSLLADLAVTYLHVFTYSERPGTPAADSGTPVAPLVRRRRNHLLRELSGRKRSAFHERMLGRVLPVLVESTVADGLRYGLTPNGIRVGIPGTAAAENTILPVRVTVAQGEWCEGIPAGCSVSASATEAA